MYDYYWFDVPLIFYDCEEGFDLMFALAENTNINIYEHTSIQMIVNKMWKAWYWRNMLFIFIPNVILLIFFSINSCFLMPAKENVPANVNLIFEVVCFLIAAYFLIIEIITVAQLEAQAWRTGWLEIIFNFAPSSFVIASQIMQMLFQYGDEDIVNTYWELLAWTSFVIWFKFLLMLRHIGWLSPIISMVMLSFQKMCSYIIVLLVGIFAFTDSFKSIQ